MYKIKKNSICQKSKLVKIELCTRKYVANLISQFFTICKENVGQKWALSLQKFRLRSKKLGAGRLRFRNHLLACRWQGCGSGPCMTRSGSDLGKMKTGSKNKIYQNQIFEKTVLRDFYPFIFFCSTKRVGPPIPE